MTVFSMAVILSFVYLLGGRGQWGIGVFLENHAVVFLASQGFSSCFVTVCSVKML